MAAPSVSAEQQLAEALAACSHDPLLFAETAFQWDSEELAGHRLDDWQVETLTSIRDKLMAGAADQYSVIREATSSGHGIGKSALVAILALWAMATMPDCMGVITANTDTQLKTKTQPQLVKWHRLLLPEIRELFAVEATSIHSVDPERAKTWRIDLIPWSEHNAEAFAGLHNLNKRILLIFDEASAIPGIIWETAEGALTDEDTQIIWCVFGNPTSNTGRFRECFRKHRELWTGRQIDSRTVRITNKKQIAEWQRTYGEDSDFFKVRVRGMFPSIGDKQFISTALVDGAYGKHLDPRDYEFAPSIIGVDPAWSGSDEFVIVHRKGLMCEVLMVVEKNDDDVLMAERIARYESELKASHVFVDLGYGTGIVSAGKAMGRSWHLIAFGGKSSDPGYANKRSQMWGDMRQWLIEGGAIPKDGVLYDDLIGPETKPRLDGVIQLEPKEDMKKRDLPSPNRGDALALTFAFPVVSEELSSRVRKGPALITDHEDPFVDA